MLAPTHFVFTSLALNQTQFFIGLAQELKKKGFETSLIVFHEGSVRATENAGIRRFNYFEYERKSSLTDLVQDVFAQFDVQNPHLLISHERASYEISDSEHLYKRFAK